ncbi:MAG TPA: hypothetical protein VN174_03865 [Candidatus Methanoperedens sp.]|nr:hypothetical protein [Candidatus Methanoperedens sp.]
MTEKNNNGFDIRATFEKGKQSDKAFVRLAAKAAEELWNTGIILGKALADIPEKRKIN